MNGLDLLLVAAGVMAALAGAARGAALQVLGTAGALAGLAVGFAAVPVVASLVTDGPGSTLAVVTLLVILGGALIGQAMGGAVGRRTRAVVHERGAGGPDRIAGVAVGIAGFVIAVWLGSALLISGPVPGLASLVRESRVVGSVARALPPPPDVVGRMAVYLDRQGFPQVYTGPAGVIVAPSVAPPEDTDVADALAAGQDSTVQVVASGCGGLSLGSGVVTGPGEITTAAHVVAGTSRVVVRDAEGESTATVALFDPDTDLAVLRADGVTATPLPWAGPVEAGATGAVLGFPGGQPELSVSPAAVRTVSTAVGRDIYGTSRVERQVVTLAADVQRGDSGGPFVTADGALGGIVFAASAAGDDTGYALAAESVRDAVAAAGDDPVDTGSCRFASTTTATGR